MDEGNTDRPTIGRQLETRDKISRDEGRAMVERENAAKPPIQRLIEKLINALAVRKDRWE